VKSKSSIAINKVRTGNGDEGSTTLAGKQYRKGSPVIQYLGMIDLAQSDTVALPLTGFRGESPRVIMQELLFRLGAAVASRTPKGEVSVIEEIVTFMELDMAAILKQLKPLDSFIRATPDNAALQKLRAFIRLCEDMCVEAHDRIEFESADTSPNLLSTLKVSAKALNVASDWIFAYVWFATTDQKGSVQPQAKWLPMDVEVLRSVNNDLIIQREKDADLER
jgi:cob(I)alamin adenosyltransferase